MLSEMLKDSMLTEAMILEDLHILQHYFEEMELKSEIISSQGSTPVPTLVTVLDPDDQERPRVLTNNLIPMDRDEAEYTKFLQFYTELPNPLDNIPRETLLEALLWLNTHISMGCCILAKPGKTQRLAIRCTQGYSLTKPIEGDVFLEDVFLFDRDCEIASMVLDLLAQGKTLREVEKTFA